MVKSNIFNPWETTKKRRNWDDILNQSQTRQHINTNILPTVRSIRNAIRKTESNDFDNALIRFRDVERRITLPTTTREDIRTRPYLSVSEPKRKLPPVSKWMPQRDEAAARGRFTERPTYRAGMERFREVEQTQQPGIPPPRRVYPSGLIGPVLTPSFVEMEAYATGAKFKPGVGTRQAPKPTEVAQHLLFTKINNLITSGVSYEDALKKTLDDPILSPEQRATIDRIYTGYAESQQAEYMPGTADLPTSQTDVENAYALITTGEEGIAVGLLKPMLPESVLEFIGEAPLVGPALERELEFLSTPIGLASLVAWPVWVGIGAVGGVATATAVQEMGGSEEQQLYAQIAGNILTPGAGLVSSKLITAPTRAAANKAIQGIKLTAKESDLLRRTAFKIKEAWKAEVGGEFRIPFGAKADDVLIKVDVGQSVTRSELLEAVEQERLFARIEEGPRLGETFRAGRVIPEGELPERVGVLAELRGTLVSPELLSRAQIQEEIGKLNALLKKRKGKFIRGAGRRNAIKNRIKYFEDLLKTPEELTDGELIAKLRNKEKMGQEFVEESAEEIAQRTADKVPPSSHRETTRYIETTDPSGIPPRKPPPETRAVSPDDPEFDEIYKLALGGEEVPETLMRRHDGAIRTEIKISRNETNAVNNQLRKIGLGTTFHGSTVAKVEGSFDELNRLLHNPSKVASGELTIPKELREIYEKLRFGTDWEQAARIDFDPNMATIDDYFFRGWKPPEGMFVSDIRGTFGRNPDFLIPRIDATYDEMIEAGFRPLFENPAEQLHYSRQMGIKFREQTKLLEQLKTRELARPDLGGAMPEGWRVPKVGPAFEGKPFTSTEGQAFTTQRYAVNDSLANRLENIYGVISKHWGKGKVFGKNIDFQKAVDTAVFLPKRAKLIGSVFQHVDFLSRSGVGAWTGFIDALRHGKPIESVYHLLKWPQTAFDIATVAFRPGFRERLARIVEDTTPLFKGRKLSPKMISEAGVSTYDPTILPELDKVIDAVRAEGKLLKWGKAPFRLLNDLERFWREGLFQGVYPAAIWADIKNNIAPAILRQHPNATDEQLAGMIAKAANTSYSSIPAAASVVQNKQARWFLTRFLFSLGENEGLLRTFTGSFKGENAAYFRTRLLGLYLGMMATANAIHFASTGKPLPFDRWTPISTNNWGPLPIGYNRDFAAPTIPLTGRSSTELTLDLMGQMDTAFRILDPISFLNARVSVPARALYNQARGKDFFGAPIDTVGPGGVFSRASQLAQDLFTPIGFGQAGLEALRQNINKTEGLIQPGESRLGMAGLGVQATGVNIRGEPTRDLINRIRNEVIQDMGIDTVKVDTAYAEFIGIEDMSVLEKIKQGDIVGVFEGEPSTYDKLDTLQKSDVDAEVEKRIGKELEIRQETAKIRGQTTAEGQFYDEMELLRIEQGEAQLAADDKFNSGQWAGDVWRKDYADRQREYYIRRDEHKQALKVEFKDRPAKSKIDEAISNYFDVNIDDYKQDDGTIDWEGYFGAKEETLSILPFLDRKAVMNKIINKYDTPTVSKFRKTKESLNEFYNTSSFYGLSIEMSNAIKELTNNEGLLGKLRAQQINEGKTPSNYFDILMNLAIELHNNKDFNGADIAFYAAYSTRESEARDLMNKHLEQGNTKEAAIMAGLIEGNPERDKLIMNNLELLKFYPELKDNLSEKERAYLSAGTLPVVNRFGFTEEIVSSLPEIFQRGQYDRSAEKEIIERAKRKGTDYGVPKYRYVTIQQGYQVDELLERVALLLRNARDAGQPNVPTHREYLWELLNTTEKDDPLYNVIATAYLLKTEKRESVFTPEALVEPTALMDIYRGEQELQEKMSAVSD